MMTPPTHISIDASTELRLLSESDAPELFRLIDQNRVHLRRWLPWVDATQTEEDERLFLRASRAQLLNNNGFACSICYQGQIAGNIGYHPIDWSTQRVEIGYWLAEQFQGQGLMTKACQAFTAYAFDALQLNKVEIRCAPDNIRSCAVPQRLGFIREGLIRQAGWLYDHYVDLVLYGMLADEWQKLHSRR